MQLRIRRSTVLLLAVLAATSGCSFFRSKDHSRGTDPVPVVKPAKVPPGMNDKGEVIDPFAVESGYGRKVKGVDKWEGEITGIPVPNSKFERLEIGMSMRQVTDLIGYPSDSGSYMTGKAWIPFYFGNDRYRYELTYKGVGRLIFAGGSLGNFTGGNLIWIIHSANEPGYRK